MATVERRHREVALACFFNDQAVPAWAGGWCNNGRFPPLDQQEARRWDRIGRVARALAEAEAPPSMAPVTGDRLLAALACHIDQDAPPGMAAREIARTALELLDGACNNLRPLELHEELLKLKGRFRR
jgi:hypothetical protein